MKIKVSIVLVSLALLISSFQSLNGQNQPPQINSDKKSFFREFAVFGGPGLSFLRGNPSVENNSINTREFKLGYAFGLAATHPLNQKFAISGMIIFERKGTIVKRAGEYFDEATQTLKQGEVKEDYKYDYRSLAITLDYSFGNKLKFNAGLGPFISYLESHIVQTTYYPIGTGGIEDQLSFDKRYDFGCTFKFACAMPISKKVSIQTQLLNLWGLANTRSDPNYGVIKTNSTSLLFGIIIKN